MITTRATLRTGRRACSAFLPALLVCVQAGAAADVDVVRLDGTEVSGAFSGFDGAEVRLNAGEDELRVAAGDIGAILFGESNAVEGRGHHVAMTADGGRMYGTIVGGTATGVRFDTPWAEPFDLPFDAIAALRWGDTAQAPGAQELLTERLASREVGQDVLVAWDADAEVPRPVKGRLVSLDGDGGTFDMAGRPRRFSFERTYGIIMATAGAQPPKPSATVFLADGAAVGGAWRAGEAGELRIEPFWGGGFRWETSLVKRIRLVSDRIVFVSDLVPTSTESRGVLFPDGAPVYSDQSVTGRPITLDGRIYEKGLGCRSFVSVSYVLEGPYETLVGKVGLDDEVRPRGSVQFRVLADGRVRFDSGTVTGTDAPVELRVPMEGVKNLTLVVDLADAADIADHADWADLRLIKPATAKD